MAGILYGSFWAALSCGKKKSTEPEPGNPSIDFNAEILPILQARCNTAGCHGGQTPSDTAGGLVFSSFDAMRQSIGQKTSWTKPLIIPGNPDSSHLILTIRQSRPSIMPPSPLPSLDTAEVKKIADWIKQGAKGPGGKKFPTYREGKLYAANSNDGRVDVIDLSTNYRSDFILTYEGSENPSSVQTHHITVSPDKKFIYVTNAWAVGHIIKIGTETDSVLVRARAGFQPADIVISPSGEYVYLSNYNQNSQFSFNPNSTVWRIDAQTIGLVDTFIVGRAPHGVGISKDGKLVLSPGEESDDLWFVYPDSGPNAIFRLPLWPGASFNNLVYKPFAVVLSPDDSLAYVSCTKDNKILIIDTDSRTRTDSIVLDPTEGKGPLMLAASADGNTLYAPCLLSNTLAVIDVVTKAQTYIPIGLKPHAPMPVADSLVYVTCEGNHVTPYKVYVVNTITQTVVDSIDVGRFPNGIAVLKP